MSHLALAARSALGLEPLLFCPTYLPATEVLRAKARELGIPFVCGMLPGGADNDVAGEIRERFPELCVEHSARKDPLQRGIAAALARGLCLPFSGAHFEDLSWRQFSPTPAGLDTLSLRRALWRRLARRKVLGARWLYRTFAALRKPVGAASPVPAKWSVRRRLARRIFVHAVTRRFLRCGLVSPEALGYWINFYLTLLNSAEAVTRVVEPVLGVFPEENIDYQSAVWVEALAHRGVRSICFSSDLPARSEVAQVYFDDAERQMTAARGFLVPWLKRWVHRHQGRDLIRYAPERAIAMELVGLAPRRPWVLNTGGCQTVVVESEFMRDRFVELGIDRPRRRVEASGHPVLDRLHTSKTQREELRASLRARFGLSAEKQIVICSPPTDQYSTWQPPGLPTYQDLLDLWCGSLSTLRVFEGLVSLHPSTPKAVHEALTARGIRVVGESLADVVAACDLYVCCVSSTGKWALACGVPVVNFNVYQFQYLPAERYSYLDGLSGVQTVTTVPEYLALLDRFNDPAYFAAASAAATRDAARYGVLDGHAADRIVAVLARVAGVPAPAASPASR